MRSSKLAICEGEGQVSWNRLEAGLVLEGSDRRTVRIMAGRSGCEGGWNGLQVEQGQEIDGAELAVDSRWAAEARGEIKVGAE
jgi:hypothetical protein